MMLQIWVNWQRSRKMRRRSGGFHSETFEEYMELAEQGEGRMGLFYDRVEQQGRKKERTQKRGQNKTTPSTFPTFNHNAAIQEQLHLQELENMIQKQGIIIHHYTIICENSLLVRKQLGEKSYDVSRSFDLIVRKRIAENKTQFIYQYWLINYQLLTNQICRIYLERGRKVLAVGVHLGLELQSKYMVEQVELGQLGDVINEQENN